MTIRTSATIGGKISNRVVIRRRPIYVCPDCGGAGWTRPKGATCATCDGAGTLNRKPRSSRAAAALKRVVNVRVGVLLTRDELEAIDHAARLAQMTRAQFLRQAARNLVSRVTPENRTAARP